MSEPVFPHVGEIGAGDSDRRRRRPVATPAAAAGAAGFFGPRSLHQACRGDGPVALERHPLRR